jgi:hypothetical protein
VWLEHAYSPGGLSILFPPDVGEQVQSLLFLRGWPCSVMDICPDSTGQQIFGTASLDEVCIGLGVLQPQSRPKSETLV